MAREKVGWTGSQQALLALASVLSAASFSHIAKD